MCHAVLSTLMSKTDKPPRTNLESASLLIKKQETALTLRGQRDRCRNIKGEPQIFGSFHSPRPRILFLWVWFYGGPWQTLGACQI